MTKWDPAHTRAKEQQTREKTAARARRGSCKIPSPALRDGEARVRRSNHRSTDEIALGARRGVERRGEEEEEEMRSKMDSNFQWYRRSGPSKSEKEMARWQRDTRCPSNEQKICVPANKETNVCLIAFL